MNTVDPLESQHREVEKLFFRIAHATDSETRTRLFGELTQHLVAYTAIEDENAVASWVSTRTTAKAAL